MRCDLDVTLSVLDVTLSVLDVTLSVPDVTLSVMDVTFECTGCYVDCTECFTLYVEAQSSLQQGPNGQDIFLFSLTASPSPALR